MDSSGHHTQLSAPTPPVWADLPNDVCARIFGKFKRPHRHACLALVSRQWAQVVDDPLLLADVEHLALPRNLASSMRSFCRWLEQRGRHVRRLRLTLHSCQVGRPRDQAAEALQCLAACVSACPNLEQLEIQTHFLELPVGDWIGVPRRLRRLMLDGAQASAVRVLATLERLTGLEELTVDGSELERWDASDRLPPSLTSLKIGYLKRGVGLPKLSGLSRLKHLRLEQMRLPADAYADLATLTSVTRLTLACSDKLPACLGTMTWLRALQLSESSYNRLGTPSYNEEELEAALEPLTGLTSLVLLRLSHVSRLVPHAVHGMHLETLYVETDPYQPAAPAIDLPGGAWLAGLRRLGLPPEVALSGGVDVLAGAPQLQQLELNSHWTLPDGPPMLALLGSAAQHPTLRLLSLWGRVPRALRAASDAARAANPHLQIWHRDVLKQECEEPYRHSDWI